MDIKEELELAYRKLKSYVYHENFSLDLRMKISRFEANKQIDKKLQELSKNIENFVNKKEHNLLENISYSIFPKRLTKEKHFEENSFYYSNNNSQKEYKIEKITPFINCPVEIHILSVLWLMKIGHKLDEQLTSHCYGNRLYRNEDNIIENSRIHLFHKYYEKYNQWRDIAIKKAKQLHNQGYDVAILNLDIKEYYNSIDFDFNSIESLVKDEDKWLNSLLKLVHKKYFDKIQSDKILTNQKNILPIGLLSSSVIANYYLKDFDDVIINNIKPNYFGRYVDDILFVVSNPQIPTNSSNPVDSFIEKYLIKQTWKKKVKLQKSNNKGEYEIIIGNNTLLFQEEKVKLYHLLYNESIEILNRFEEEIIKNSSEFRFQPEAEQVFESFNAESYELIYSDTINKIRSIDGIKTNKLGASKHLRKLISATQNTNSLKLSDLENISKKISEYFTGVRSIELNVMWEKVLTFYVINEAKKPLIEFIKEQLSLINKIQLSKDKFNDNELIKNNVITTLKQHLQYSIAMAATLNRFFFKENIVKQFSEKEDYVEEIKKTANTLIEANMFRQQYSFFPLLNYCKQEENFSYTNKDIHKNTKFTFDKYKIRLSPRFIHYHELLYFYYLKNWNNNSIESNIEKVTLQKYIEFNKLDNDKGYSKYYPFYDNKIIKSRKVKSVIISKKNKNNRLKVGIANLKINLKDSINSMKGKPNLSFEKLNRINIILNEALRNNCDLIIFPEISIPYQWINILTNFARKNSIGVIAGIEHLTRNDKVYNFLFTALPFKFQVYNNLFIDFRLKKDYSPDEKKEIIGRTNYKLPTNKEFTDEKLRLYVWNNLLFSSLNCFELSDIEKRSIFRGNVDFLVTVEYNKDIRYFSNITESVARDIHSYIIQVNTSDYGDSRVTQPAETFRKDIVKIKGGENVSILTSTLDIEKLREFQSFNHILQSKYKWFKPTPPNFEKNKYR